jgi:hypothetical protein
MKHPRSGWKLGICALALGLSGWANAACYIGPETLASTVQADSGNGTYNCSLTSSATTGLPLYDVSAQATVTTNPDGTVNWTVPVQNGYQLNVDLVSVASNSGKRCNYTYPSLTTSGNNLSTTITGDTSKKSVTICSTTPNPVLVELPPPPEPFSTAKDQCEASFTNAGTGSSFDVAIGYSKQYEGGLYEGVAICAGSGQKQCINECVPREYSTTCTANPDGTLPLSCAQCEWDAPLAVDNLFGQDMKYCWNYENRVDEIAGTFKPSPKKKSVSTQIDVSTGSNCYTVTTGPLYGGKTYSYWYCPTY